MFITLKLETDEGESEEARATFWLPQRGFIKQQGTIKFEAKPFAASEGCGDVTNMSLVTAVPPKRTAEGGTEPVHTL